GGGGRARGRGAGAGGGALSSPPAAPREVRRADGRRGGGGAAGGEAAARARGRAREGPQRGGGGCGRPAAASEEEEDDGFSFLARSFSGVETTPKFGSFNPAAAKFVAFHLASPPPLVDPAEESPPVAVGGDGEEKGKDGNSH
uniref:Uncharacterized protein n=1 Tax=Aegilops tauschii subsp. strangulata TaxID=200361 RepID=A0A453LMM2_AEGTS